MTGPLRRKSRLARARWLHPRGLAVLASPGSAPESRCAHRFSGGSRAACTCCVDAPQWHRSFATPRGRAETFGRRPRFEAPGRLDTWPQRGSDAIETLPASAALRPCRASPGSASMLRSGRPPPAQWGRQLPNCLEQRARSAAQLAAAARSRHEQLPPRPERCRRSARESAFGSDACTHVVAIKSSSASSHAGERSFGPPGPPLLTRLGSRRFETFGGRVGCHSRCLYSRTRHIGSEWGTSTRALVGTPSPGRDANRLHEQRSSESVGTTPGRASERSRAAEKSETAIATPRAARQPERGEQGEISRGKRGAGRDHERFRVCKRPRTTSATMAVRREGGRRRRVSANHRERHQGEHLTSRCPSERSGTYTVTISGP